MVGVGSPGLPQREQQPNRASFARPGLSAKATLEHLKTNDAFYTYRQIGVIDRNRRLRGLHRPGVRGWCGEVTGENYVATGNGLVGQHVVEEIARDFLPSPTPTSSTAC